MNIIEGGLGILVRVDPNSLVFTVFMGMAPVSEQKRSFYCIGKINI